MKTSMLGKISARIEKSWYQNRWWNIWLLPLSGLFFMLSHCRRLWLTRIKHAKKQSAAPVVIIGNVNVGGTGKTPLACYLVEALASKGIKVGIISRGYGSTAPYYPYVLSDNENAVVVGDEPKLLRDRLNCPVIIGADRNAALALMSTQDIDLILSDDGLQHYEMARDYEIIVLDATRKLGNGWLLPAGPLREGSWRLKTADSIIYNGSDDAGLGMRIKAAAWVNAKTGQRKYLEYFAGKNVHAVAGIGNPQRFFSTLDDLNVGHADHVFVDHHKFIKTDLDLADEFSSQLVMTEKDWVKCGQFATESMWYLEVNASLDNQLEAKLLNDLISLAKSSEHTKK